MAKRTTLKSKVVTQYERLEDAIRKAEHKKGISILDHFVTRCWSSDNALFVLMHKLLANKNDKQIEIDQSKNIIINVVGVNGRNERSRLTSSTDAGVQSEETLLGTGSGS